jgi:hypothetical protein
VRRSPLQPVLALAVLVAGPLLGCRGEVCAGLVLNQAAPPSLSLGLLDREAGSSSSSFQGSGEGAPPLDVDAEPAPGRPGKEARAADRLPGGLRPSDGGAGSPPSGPGSGGPVLYAIVSAPVVPQATRSALLFLNDTLSWPPPFASRLFRPPRVV